LTGARRANLLAMGWEDVNLDTGLWRIPGEVAKAGEVIVIPLVQQAVDILRRRLQSSGGSPWVFPAQSKSGHLIDPNAHWRRILKRAGLQDLRIHDLRRSLGSWQAITGAPLLTIGKSLGHSSIQSTMVYARLNTATVRESVERATAAMLTAGGVNGKEGLSNGEAKD